MFSSSRLTRRSIRPESLRIGILNMQGHPTRVKVSVSIGRDLGEGDTGDVAPMRLHGKVGAEDAPNDLPHESAEDITGYCRDL
jgi:hypothetical protein